MAAKLISLLLAVALAAHIGLASLSTVCSESMPCCASESVGSSTQPDHDSPSTQTRSCCLDCLLQLPALLAESSTSQHKIARLHLLTFPLVAWHAVRRVEEPPVPPPRDGENSAPGPAFTLVVT